MHLECKDEPDGSVILNCESSPAEIVLRMFCEMPGFKLKWTCNKCNMEEFDNLILTPISSSDVKQIEIDDILVLGFQLLCHQNNCDGIKIKTMVKTGNYTAKKDL